MIFCINSFPGLFQNNVKENTLPTLVKKIPEEMAKLHKGLDNSAFNPLIDLSKY